MDKLKALRLALDAERTQMLVDVAQFVGFPSNENYDQLLAAMTRYRLAQHTLIAEEKQSWHCVS